MKKTFNAFIAAALGLTLLTGCIKVIDPQTYYVTTEQAAEAEGSYDKFVTAITNSLCGSFTYSGSSEYPYDYGYPSFFLQRDVMGNDIAIEDSSSEWYSSWYEGSYTLGPGYAICQVPWTYYYGWIKSCNNVLSLAGEEPDEDKVYGVGIAYCMRAMFYMDIARMFSQKTYGADKTAETVPIVLETSSIDDLRENPRATNEEIWDLIISDLDNAEYYLADYVRSDKYTPDLSVVYGLKARAYLTMEDWTNAEKYAQKAEEGYTMLTEEQYLSRTDGFNTPNGSWMFAVTFKDTDENILENDGDSSWGAQMIIEVSESECGYAANYGTPKRIDRHLYETIPDTDFRKKCFIDFAIDDMDEESAIAALSAYSDAPEGILTTGEATGSGVVGGLEVKFRPKGGEHANQYTAWTVAVPLMRVEEMYLIEAEAAGRQGDEERGKQLLTAFAQTRDPNYVYGTHASEAYINTSTTDFVNEVWWQRRVELWGEGFATFDIKRLDKGVIRSYANSNHPESYRWNYGTYSTNSGNNYPDWMDLCIVQTEVNYNTVCTNNPIPNQPTLGASDEYEF